MIIRERSVTIDGGGLALRVMVWGREDDPTVVVVHGNGAHAHWWAPLLPSLVPGWRVVAPDLRGHGESEWAEPPAYTVFDFANDLDAVVHGLVPDSVRMVGHSMGGRIALWFAVSRPFRMAALGIVDSRVEPVVPSEAEPYRRGAASGPRNGRTYSTREAALAAFRFVPDEPDVPPDVVALLAERAIVERRPGEWGYRFDRAVLRPDGGAPFDFARLPRLVGCPAWVASGRASWVCDAAARERMVAAFRRARGDELPGGHHGLVAHGAVAGGLLRRFLDGTR